MKVAVLHNLARGGAHRRLKEQLRHIDAEVVEVCLSTAVPVTANPQVVPLTMGAPAASPAMRPPLRYADLVALVHAWTSAGRIVRDLGVDALYANPCQFLQAPGGLLVRNLPPSVYHCDEVRRVDYETEAGAMRNPRTRLLYGPLYQAERQLDRRGVARATHITTNSRYAANAIATAYGRRSEPIPMGVSEGFHAPESARKPRHLLTVGTLIPTKGHDLVIRAAAATTQRWPVLVIAPRPAKLEEQRLRALARELDVELDVQVGVTDEELRSAYAAAFATLYLARAEPLGLVSLEAQACGCPVIVADEGGLPETVDNGRSGLVIPRCADAAAAALSQLARPGQREALARFARQRSGTWTWAISAERLHERLVAVAT